LARWNLAVDDTPISGTLQFAPLRQVLDGRVKRRIRRNGLSEEINLIEDEKKRESKGRKAEIEKLKEELRQKDLEMEYMREEHEIASQVGGEATTPISVVKELEAQITTLKAELQKHEANDTNMDWTTAARDPYDHDDDTIMLSNFDEEFNPEATSIFVSTPARGSFPSMGSFPSPPATVPNTPCKPNASHDIGIQASLSDPEKVKLQGQLTTLRAELQALTASLELTNTTHERLFAKASPFAHGEAENTIETLDSALDSILTDLALSQSSALENAHRCAALENEVATLGFGTDLEATVKTLLDQFRRARLDLEYLLPGEQAEGFDNAKLLDMLLARLKVLVARTKSQADNIDQYHEQELSLRKQLSARIDAANLLQKTISDANEEIKSLSSDLVDRDSSLKKLKTALEGYRSEVRNLESLITRLDSDHSTVVSSLTNDLQTAKSVATTSATAKSALQATNQEQSELIADLQARLDNALATLSSLQAELDAKTTELANKLCELDNKDHQLETAKSDLACQSQNFASALAGLRADAAEREKEHGQALALRDARVAELRDEVERVNVCLRGAQKEISVLKNEVARLREDIGGVRARNEKMRGELRRVLETGESPKRSRTMSEGPAASVFGEGIAPVRKGGLFDHSAARRSSSVGLLEHETGAAVVVAPRDGDTLTLNSGSGSGSAKKSKKRRRYDSGLGFLEEEDEDNIALGV
jgi:DNA repair exonuclease SbcCD ATPase subunit